MKTIVVSAACLAALLVPSLARAEGDRGTETKSVAYAPKNAWEITVGNGYSQGFGRATEGKYLSDFARGGFSSQLGFGYRIDPRLFVGIYAEGSRYSVSNRLAADSTAYGAAFGAQANWHFMPYSRIDPWIGLGAGGRAYWIDPSDGPAEALYGVDIARLRVGADYRLGPSTSIGPMLGATLTSFVAHQSVRDEPEEIDQAGLSTVVFAGLQGRFDLGGERVPAGRTSVASR